MDVVHETHMAAAHAGNGDSRVKMIIHQHCIARVCVIAARYRRRRRRNRQNFADHQTTPRDVAIMCEKNAELFIDCDVYMELT